LFVGGVELGGTKVVCVVGAGREIVAEQRLPTGEPAATLAAVASFFEGQRTDGRAISGLGIASFGPLELREAHPDFGRLTATPKAGWSRVDVAGPLRKALGVPVALDTDVNAAALAEGRFGAARGCGSLVYLTVGTGIGGGALVGGSTLHGFTHPEMGHVAVARLDGDTYPGRCPFHGDCLEGMVSGPALAERFGAPLDGLSRSERERAAVLTSGYLAQLLRSILYILVPERIVIGGGVSQLPGLVPLVADALVASLGGYPVLSAGELESLVVPAELGHSAGPVGALILGERALAS
jgi:fructokinase